MSLDASYHRGKENIWFRGGDLNGYERRNDNRRSALERSIVKFLRALNPSPYVDIFFFSCI